MRRSTEGPTADVAPRKAQGWIKEPVLLKCLFSEENLARETGLEPATSGVTGRRSNQLSYSRKIENDPQEVGLKGGDISSQGAPSLFLFVRNFGNRPASCRNTAYP